VLDERIHPADQAVVDTEQYWPNTGVPCPAARQAEASQTDLEPVSTLNINRYDTTDDLHWKTDRQAASLI